MTITYFDSIQKEIEDLIELISKEKDITYKKAQEIIERAISKAIQYDLAMDEEIKIELKNGKLITYVKEEEDFVERNLLTKSRLTVANMLRNIQSSVNEIDKDKELKYFEDKIGHIMIGKIQEVTPKNILVQINSFSVCLPKNMACPNDKNMNINQKIQVLIESINPENKVYQTIVSRNSATFVEKLLETEIPEIYDGLVKIHSSARIPGVKTKVAVYSVEQNLNPISCCLGVSGSRISSIRKEIHNEIVDIILYSTNKEQFIINAMMPAKPLDIVQESGNKYIVIVREENVSIALGKFMSNIKLACELTGADLSIMTESEYEKENAKTRDSLISHLMSNLDVNDMTARLLIASDFKSIDKIATTSLEQLEELALSGYSKPQIASIQQKAIQIMIEEEDKLLEQLEELEFSQEIIDILPLEDKNIYLKLAEAGIKTLEDLAVTTLDELKVILTGTDISEDEIENILTDAKRKQGL